MMADSVPAPKPVPAPPLRSRCPDCNGRLSVLRVIGGNAASEYWTQRCIRCGGIHLDIVKPDASPPS